MNFLEQYLVQKTDSNHLEMKSCEAMPCRPPVILHDFLEKKPEQATTGCWGGGRGVAENLNIRSEHKNCRQILQFSDKFLLSYDYRGCTLLLLRGYLRSSKSKGGRGTYQTGRQPELSTVSNVWHKICTDAQNVRKFQFFVSNSI